MQKITLELTQEQLDTIKKQLPEVFEEEEFKVGDEYFFKSEYGYGYVDSETFENTSLDRKRIEIGNVFHTREEAENSAKKDKAIASIKQYIKKHGMSFKPDWKNFSQYKYNIVFKHDEIEYTASSWTRHEALTDIPRLSSIEHAEQVIRDCKAELDIIRECE